MPAVRWVCLLVYSGFAASEYMTVLSNVGFHSIVCSDFSLTDVVVIDRTDSKPVAHSSNAHANPGSADRLLTESGDQCRIL